jgi:tRNA/tmRNA/rRNA uracil-C5-methylase (TrmA/RlmC/RlmD family)
MRIIFIHIDSFSQKWPDINQVVGVSSSSSSSANSSSLVNLLKLYCGNGNHTVAISSFFKYVLAVERNENLVTAARYNLKVL